MAIIPISNKLLIISVFFLTISFRFFVTITDIPAWLFKRSKIKQQLSFIESFNKKNLTSETGSNIKSKFKSLTKKQRKKLRMRKANRLIYTESGLFKKSIAFKRNFTIMWFMMYPTFFTKTSKVFVHDGYSWDVLPPLLKTFIGFKSGQFVFKTRPISVVKFHEKGKSGKIQMKQPSTFKVKQTKVKRRK